MILKINDVRIRKFAPVLEREIASGNGILQSNEWKTVPDIWRTCAEKFGDRAALVDHYHDPPTNMTYKQVSLGPYFLIVFSLSIFQVYVITCIMCSLNNYETNFLVVLLTFPLYH